MNIQFKNVGNLGDILKHAALIQISKVIPKNTLYVDFHTFQIQAPFSNFTTWKKTVEDLGDGYKDYKNSQKSENYRCSSGIALDLYKGTNSHFIFSEENSETRISLKKQIEHELRDYLLMENSRDLKKHLDYVKKLSFDNFFGLIDPFKMTKEEFDEISQGINQLSFEKGVILCFDYDKLGGSNVDWSVYSPPKGFSLISKISQENHALSCFATKNIEKELKEKLKELNWQ